MNINSVISDMKSSVEEAVTPRCFICGNDLFLPVFAGRFVNGYALCRCLACGLVVARSENSTNIMDYSDYGDYLLDQNNVQRNLMVTKKAHLSLLEKYYSGKRDLAILDYGAGAGFFVKIAADYGFLAKGVEPSYKLREFAFSTLGQRLYSDIDEVGGNFDVICMFDVIEHISEFAQRKLMTLVLSKLKSGGVLIGNTPNWRSANIIIRKDADPAVWPPSHTCYFVSSNLDAYFKSLGLKKVNLYSKGFRSFRTNKDCLSFLEKPSNSLLMKWCAINPAKAALRILSHIFSPFGFGYQIYFEYKKNE